MHQPDRQRRNCCCLWWILLALLLVAATICPILYFCCWKETAGDDESSVDDTKQADVSGTQTDVSATSAKVPVKKVPANSAKVPIQADNETPLPKDCPMNPHTYYCCIKHKLFKKIGTIKYPACDWDRGTKKYDWGDTWYRNKRKEAFTRLFKDLEKEAKKNGGAPPYIAFEGYWKDLKRTSGPRHLVGFSKSKNFIQKGPRVQLWNALIDKTIDGKPFVGFVDAFLAVTYKHDRRDITRGKFSFALSTEMVWPNARRRLTMTRLGQAQEMTLQ